MKLDAKDGGSPATLIAQYLVSLAQKHGDPLSNLKLQKLLYYAQGWFLIAKQRPLFRDPIQAWPRGPVVYSVWRLYKKYRWNPITEAPPIAFYPVDAKIHLEEIYRAYGGLGAYDLEIMTHSEPPWLRAREGLSKDEPSTNEISLDSMWEYFQKLHRERAR